MVVATVTSTPAVQCEAGVVFVSVCLSAETEQVAQLSQRNRAAAWVSFGWVMDDGVGQ